MTKKARPRSSSLARIGIATLAGALLAGSPATRAGAAESARISVSNVPGSTVGELDVTRHEAGERLRRLTVVSLDRTAQRMRDLRRRLHRAITSEERFEALEKADPPKPTK